MVEMNRRRFLFASTGLTAAGLLAGGVFGLPELMQAARDRPLAAGSGILVLVTMYGGNDGINSLIPYADPAYHQARPELAYAASDVLHLDSQLGLNPGMRGLAGLWQKKQLAIVRGVGYPKPDHSHFRSMDIWQTASPEEPVSTGWIGRWLDATGDDPLRAVNIGTVLPPLAVGEKVTAAALSVKGDSTVKSFAETIDSLGTADPQDTPAMAMVRGSYRSAQTADAALQPATQQPVVRPAHQQAKAASGLAEQLEVVARCIKAGVPTQVYTVSLGGFDTHANERGTQQRLLGQLDAAVTGFLQQMSSDPRGKNLVLMTYSEFGRRVRANASQGTDHGTAGPMFIAGLPVKGGFYGDEPSLTDLDNGDLKVTTDFRDVYHEVLACTLGADPAPIVGSNRKEVGFL
ncbi:DUF1501 domain-containing protein [Mycobacterium sp. OTB74]|jgi:uncharacterized protein (DUF1501 family)|uniref:DUF1501 domain-containing protein n=1 Tax=Mycobacterium sp. OTB74 TaxID=1853452 RepID=UPI002477090F|nr:DUF1501 domain-containing protein [Mycobacterium sp. OTB74]MDH6245595.1 uncharacterized protein (DUF1501 family) [Mycobacterium sp. OTB74]